MIPTRGSAALTTLRKSCKAGFGFLLKTPIQHTPAKTDYPVWARESIPDSPRIRLIDIKDFAGRPVQRSQQSKKGPAMKHLIGAGAVFALAISALSLSLSAEDMPAWQLALQEQLLAEKQCSLNYMTNVKVQELGAITSIEARAHCMDGQAYDVRSMKGTTKFDIRECGITVC